MQFELIDDLLYLVMDILEFAVSKFRGFCFMRCLVYDLQHVCDLAVDARFVGDYLRFQVHFYAKVI